MYVTMNPLYIYGLHEYNKGNSYTHVSINVYIHICDNESTVYILYGLYAYNKGNSNVAS